MAWDKEPQEDEDKRRDSSGLPPLTQFSSRALALLALVAAAGLLSFIFGPGGLNNIVQSGGVPAPAQEGKTTSVTQDNALDGKPGVFWEVQFGNDVIIARANISNRTNKAKSFFLEMLFIDQNKKIRSSDATYSATIPAGLTQQVSLSAPTSFHDSDNNNGNGWTYILSIDGKQVATGPIAIDWEGTKIQ